MNLLPLNYSISSLVMLNTTTTVILLLLQFLPWKVCHKMVPELSADSNAGLSLNQLAVQCSQHSGLSDNTTDSVLWYRWPLFEAEEHPIWKFSMPDNWNAFCEVCRLYMCSVSTEVCSVRSCQSHSLPEKTWSSSHWILMIKRLLNTPRTQQLCVICSSR